MSTKYKPMSLFFLGGGGAYYWNFTVLVAFMNYSCVTYYRKFRKMVSYSIKVLSVLIIAWAFFGDMLGCAFRAILRAKIDLKLFYTRHEKLECANKERKLKESCCLPK